MYSPHSTAPAHQWLLTVSLILAVLLEFIPIEMEWVYFHLVDGNVFHYVLVKAMFVTAILLPLSVYKSVNGLSWWKVVHSKRAVAIILIMALSLFLNIVLLLR